MKRTFLAIPIVVGTEYPALVQSLQRNLEHERKNINWCKTNQIHLTLKFVGDTPDQDVPKIIEACQQVAQRHQPFIMDFNRTGIFGSNHSLRVNSVICVTVRTSSLILPYVASSSLWTSLSFSRCIKALNKKLTFMLMSRKLFISKVFYSPRVLITRL